MTEEEYILGLIRMEEIFQAKPGTPEADELDALAIKIREYDEKHYPIN